jgi:Zn finger protein HypA/HybF involved in hydrogenase expression
VTHDPPLTSTAAMTSRPLRQCCGVLDSRIALPAVCPTCRCPGAEAVKARDDYWRGREGAKSLGVPRPVLRVLWLHGLLGILPFGGLAVGAFLVPTLTGRFGILSIMPPVLAAFAAGSLVRTVTHRRLRALLEYVDAAGRLACTNCGHPLALSEVDPVTCPECGFVAMRSDVERGWAATRPLIDVYRPRGLLRFLDKRRAT